MQESIYTIIVTSRFEVTNCAVKVTNRAGEVTNRADEVTNRAVEIMNRADEVTNRVGNLPARFVTSLGNESCMSGRGI